LIIDRGGYSKWWTVRRIFARYVEKCIRTLTPGLRLLDISAGVVYTPESKEIKTLDFMHEDRGGCLDDCPYLYLL